jgi:glucosamine--fructose-6-phosphate aminotransferase (isomerizing)
MCGIIGYIGSREALPILLSALHSMEYRGYDSAGVGLLRYNSSLRIELHRAVGPIANLERQLKGVDASPTIGIGHTRWATHGAVTVANAHPHLDEANQVAVVHNGVIENDQELREALRENGVTFRSETDTELLAILIGRALEQAKGDLVIAVQIALARVRGTYGIVVMSLLSPDVLVAACCGSPVLLAQTDDGVIVASDQRAILPHATKFLRLQDGCIALLYRRDLVKIRLGDVQYCAEFTQEVEGGVEDAKKGGYPHFMLKEIFEQPDTVRRTILGRVNRKTGMAVLGGLRDHAEILRGVTRLHLVGCGSAFYAAQIGKYLIQRYAGVPVSVELASEAHAQDPLYTQQEAVVAISQSGETMDTLLAVREAVHCKIPTFGIVNCAGSAIARTTGAGIYTRAGLEVGVASTKAFVSQITALGLMALFLGRQRTLSDAEGLEIVRAFEELPDLIERLLESISGANQMDQIVSRLTSARGALYLGRGINAPVAMEGALKMKEVSYIHAEGYAAGEMKHGPLALIDEDFPTVAVCPADTLHDKTRSNLQEIRARRGPVYAVTTEGNHGLDAVCEGVIFVPHSHPIVSPVLSVIPLQLLAYKAAIARGFDPDRPRNLAKAVTTE